MRSRWMLKWIVICLLVAMAVAIFPSRTLAQETTPPLLASLRPNHELRWQRTSPSAEKPDGPVLYQLLFSGGGTPGTVPAFDTNPRHLTNSPITVSGGNVVIGGASGLSINGTTGFVTFANGQVFPGTTGVNSVTSGNGFITVGGTPANPTVGLNTTNADVRYLTLSGGTMTGNIVFAAGQTFPASGLPNLAGEVTGPPGTTVVSNAVATNVANAVVRRDATGNFSAGTIALAGNLTLPDTASASVGVLSMGASSFLHNCCGAAQLNTFVGAGAGNMTMTGGSNTVVGAGALHVNTSGVDNSAFGRDALAHSTANTNSAFGAFALAADTSGDGNAAFGTYTMALNTTGVANSAFGAGALYSNVSGSNNAAFGNGALDSNTTANNNSAFGYSALILNSTGSNNAAFGTFALNRSGTASGNSAFGASALERNDTGPENTAMGYQALNSNTTGDENTAVGKGALYSNYSGRFNTAVGWGSLLGVATGSNNIALGMNAGSQLAFSDSSNIDIGNDGMVGDSNTIRIGSTQTATFIAGVAGRTVGAGSQVFVGNGGQLGTLPSSRRYKDGIADLGSESDLLMKLRPVVFYYKPELDATHTRQYGLVAEEVAQIAPDLVVFDEKGAPQTVRYHFVNAMLLNEVQKQRRLIETQLSENEAQHQQIASLQQQIQAQQKQMEAVMLRLADMEKSVQPGTQLAGVR